MPSQLIHLLRALDGPLLVEPAFGARMAAVVARHLAGGALFGPQLHAAMGVAMPEQRAERRPAPPRIAVIPIEGAIAQHPHSMGTSTDEIGALVDRAVANPDVDAILYHVDSSGGTVGGVPETASKIAAAAQVKPSLALANGMAASAAYWMAAAAGEVWVSPSGDGVGSIGVWTMHQDLTRALEQEGVAITEIAAGKFKTEGAPWKPLTEEGLAFLQERVNELYAWFVKDVAAYRQDTPAQVRSGYGEGRVLPGKLAMAAKLADRVGTFEEAAERLAKRARPTRRGPRASLLREQLALDTA